MLAIRLFRFGTKNRPTYRVVVSQKQKDTHGDYLESLGYYNPRSNPKVIFLKEDRILYWLSVGAKASATVQNLLVSQGIVEGPKVRAFKMKAKDREKQKTEGAPSTAPVADIQH